MPLASAVIAIALLALLIIVSNSRLDFLNRIRHPAILTSLLLILVFLTLFVVDRYHWRFIPQTELANVSLGDELPQALETLGDPLHQDSDTYYFNNGMLLKARDRTILEIGLHQPSHLSLSGIRVGMPLAKLDTLMGSPDSVSEQTYRYERINLMVTIDNDTVSEVRIFRE